MHNQAAEAVLASYVMASGKMLPFDSGKFHVCEALKKQTPPIDAKFFLVTLQVVAGKMTVPAELGLCLPAVCRDEDFHGKHDDVANIIRNVTGHAPFDLVVPTYSIAHPQPPGTLRHPNPANVADDLKPWGTGATIATCVVGVLVLMAIFSTAVVFVAQLESTEIQRRAASALDTTAQIRPGDLDTPVQPNASATPLVSVAPGRPSIWRQLSSVNIIESWSLIGRKGTWTDLWKCPASRPTDCLNGMRVLSMAWIVLGHSFLMSQANAGYDNSEDIEKSPLTPDAAETTWQFQIIMGSEMGVDTFFYISGFLLSFIGRGRKTPVFLGTVLRYFRIVPAMAFMILLYGWISPYLMFGPFAPRAQQSILRKCEANWWVNLLFIMNFYPRNPSELCAGWTWYLGNDFQFAIIGMFLLNIWKRRPLLAWASIVLLLACSFTISIDVGFQRQLGVYVLAESDKYTYYLYNYPWHRIPVFLVGVALPWLLDALERRGLGRNPDTPKTLKARVAWICAGMIAAGVMLAVIFVPLTDYPGGSGSSRQAMNWSRTACVLFITFSRPIWALAIAVVTAGCYYGYFPLLNGFFSHWIWQPFVKLTYGAYLFHPMVVKQFAANMVSYYHYSMSEVLLHAGCHCALSYAAAVVMWCIVEKPFATLVESAVPKGRSRGSQEESGKVQPQQGAAQP
jgi:peptidoglycan/LPS O-acetylase OafA/YrhL